MCYSADSTGPMGALRVRPWPKCDNTLRTATAEQTGVTRQKRRVSLWRLKAYFQGLLPWKVELAFFFCVASFGAAIAKMFGDSILAW